MIDELMAGCRYVINYGRRRGNERERQTNRDLHARDYDYDRVTGQRHATLACREIGKSVVILPLVRALFITVGLQHLSYSF